MRSSWPDGRRRAGLQHRLLALALLGGGCAATAGRPVATAPSLAPPRVFSNEDLDRVQSRFVDDAGRVDYAGLAREPADLERYSSLCATYSPDSDPAIFPTREHELAYWINAYNAAVIATVLRYYPVSSVTDVPTPFPLSLFSDKIGFFVLQKVTLGGKSMSLYELENSVIRSRYHEPRIHFALNCASGGCPRLPQRAFQAADLDGRLDHETRRFFSEQRNLRIDHEARVVHLSAILDWYRGDFITWYEDRHPGRDATLLDYVALYVDPERHGEIERAREYEIEFVPYDWRLNDQARGA